MTRLTIVVVAYNARDDLARMLDSLTAAPPSVPHEIVVVDNASTDGAPELVRSRFPQIRVIAAGGNVGFAKANNIGIRSTASDLILLLNPDTTVPPGAIDRLTARLDESPEVAVIGPRVVDERGDPELSIGGPVNPWREAGRKALLSLDARGHGAGAAMDRKAGPAGTGRGMGDRRLPAAAPGRRGSRGAPGRTVLSVSRRRGFLRRGEGPRASGPVLACRRDRSPAGAFRRWRRRARARRLAREPSRLLSQTPPDVGSSSREVSTVAGHRT